MYKCFLALFLSFLLVLNLGELENLRARSSLPEIISLQISLDLLKNKFEQHTESGATMGAMGSAAFSTLVSRASISMINNGGDLGKVMQDLGSRESLRSLATVIISAGIVGGVTSGLGISVAPDSSQTTTFMEKTVTHLQHNLVRSGVSSVVSSGLEGTNLGDNLIDGLKSAVVNSVASATANTIGEKYDDGKGDLSYGIHKGLHFGLGAGAGLALGGDLESAVSGGVGGLVGKIRSL